MKEIEAKLNNAIEINDAANKSIADLQALVLQQIPHYLRG